MALIELEHIVKTYDLGLSKVRRCGTSIFPSSAASSSPSSGSRGRQVDADEHHRLPRRAHRRPLPALGRDVSALSDDELADVRNLEIGFVFQSFQLLPRASALENVELPLVYRGVGKKERHDRAVGALKMVGLEDRMKHKPAELSGWPAPEGGDRPRPRHPALAAAGRRAHRDLDSRTGEEIVGCSRVARAGPTPSCWSPRAQAGGALPAGGAPRRRAGDRRRPGREVAMANAEALGPKRWPSFHAEERAAQAGARP